MTLESYNDEQEQLLRAARIVKAKESRYTLASRILTNGSQVSVSLIDHPRQHVAWYDMTGQQIVLNNARPVARNPVTGLIWDRAKLFHELGHAIFTTEGKRTELYNKSSNQELFLFISNALEDGRIEWKMGERFQGTKAFFAAFVAEMFKAEFAMNGSTKLRSNPNNALLLFVRGFAWRNAADEKYWKPFEGEIKRAIRADETAIVNQIAFDIVEALSKHPRLQAHNSESQKGEGKGEGEGEGGKGGNKGEGESEGSDSSGAQGSGGGNGSGPKETVDSTFGPIAKDVMEALERAMAEAVAQVVGDCAEEWDSILAEVDETQGAQEYANSNEQSDAQVLSALFRSLMVEQSRVKFHSTRAGLLNSLALPRALTNRRCFHKREAASGAPHVALLLDCSGSMSQRRGALSEAARVLNGALREGGVEVLTVQFGHKQEEGGGAWTAEVINRISAESGLRCCGSTPTHSALKVANDWLEERQASRGLIIAITDGAADLYEATKAELERANRNGAYSVAVEVACSLGCAARYGFDACLVAGSPSELPVVLEPVLLDFVSGR